MIIFVIDNFFADEQLTAYLDSDFCSIVDNVSYRNPCNQNMNIHKLELKKFKDSFIELEDKIQKQIKNNEEKVNKTLKDFEGKIGKDVKDAETKVVEHLESLASNVETRIQMREREIDGSIRLSVKEVEGSLKVFEREVESYMRNVIKNIDENLINHEKQSMDKMGQYIAAVEENMQKLIISVHSNIEAMLNEVKENIKQTCGKVEDNSTRGVVVEAQSQDLQGKDSWSEARTQGSEDSQVAERFGNIQEEILIKEMEMASVISVEERDRQNQKDIEQRQTDESIHLAVACQRGEECRKPDYLGKEYAYIFNLDYYLAKDPGKRKMRG